MAPSPYPFWMRTIEAIRLANYRRLIEEVKGDRDIIRGVEIAAALGITPAYVSQLANGVRTSIDSVAARKIERQAGKPEGWMDTDFEMWPFPDADLLGRLERLKPAERIEIQGVIKERLDRYENRTGAGVAESGKSALSSGGQKRSAQA